MNARLPSPRLWLDPPVAADEAFYVALYTDPATMRHVAAPQSVDAARRGFAAALRLDAEEPPQRRFWVLRSKDDGERIGLLGLHIDAEGRGEVGAVIVPSHQGRGHSTAAIGALADHAFDTLGLQCLHTRHDGGNGLAAGLMARVGFVCTATADGATGWRWELSPSHWRALRAATTAERIR